MPSFHKILNLCSGLSKELTDVVFIGGVAVYLHTMKRSLRRVPLETSHDADFMISFADYGILKDEEELTPNSRLGKHQMIVEGVEFDVYVEKLCRLAVPYDEVFANATTIEGIRVASLEHLLVLKLEALEARGHSSKGDKDRRDVAKIGLLLGNKLDYGLVSPYLRESLVELVRKVAKSTIFFELCEHNAHDAKKARTAFSAFSVALDREP